MQLRKFVAPISILAILPFSANAAETLGSLLNKALHDATKKSVETQPQQQSNSAQQRLSPWANWKQSSQNGLITTYTGEVEIRGKVQLVRASDHPLAGSVCMYPMQTHLNRIPRLPGDTRPAMFCFEADSQTYQALGMRASGAKNAACLERELTVVVSSYVENQTPSTPDMPISDIAHLVKVAQADPGAVPKPRAQCIGMGDSGAPTPSATAASRTSQGWTRQQSADACVRYTGHVEVSGTFVRDATPAIADEVGDRVCFTADSSGKRALPPEAGTSFCFDNQPDAAQALRLAFKLPRGICKVTGTANIVLSAISLPGDGSVQATLERSLGSGNPQMERCR
ncbi:hypothetical protein OPU71_10210 [Niveibacterium sp. 24ML]|uniref:hypothetical protein n=1 Tax=Niveibacterium sp. 24ML TaxID=2985512 RepID=UPI00226FD2CF|nr:hypothetical protein [Niveibacterium sp. 24ML]MCX9156494.1 hypothetical protein [Niveibacterium sp. 24ML]